MLYFIAFAGGMLTIVSPCILPVLPFVFARAGEPFRRSGLPLLVGMALTFALVGGLAAVAGEWIVSANQIGRAIALVVFAGVGTTLLSASLAERLARPFVRLGGAVQARNESGATFGGAALRGVATGLLSTPCAGPILGLILSAVAIQGNRASSALLLMAFAAGAASALGLALFAAGRALALLTRSLGAEVWIRRGLGVAVLAGVIGIALGWDSGVLARVSLTTFGTATGLEQGLVDRVRPNDVAPPMTMAPAMMMQGAAATSGEVMTAMPSLGGAVDWLNSAPLSRAALHGKVVLIDFWTYSCINCVRAIPYVNAWAQKYQSAGLVVIGVHTPEFAFERDVARVRKASRDLRISYPVAVDSGRTIWNAFRNQYWPAHYLVDRDGNLRYHYFGEEKYDETESAIRSLLGIDRGEDNIAESLSPGGVQAAADLDSLQSPETYVGYERQENFAAPQLLSKDRDAHYTVPARLPLNQWALQGTWIVPSEEARLLSPAGALAFRFHARDLHLVLGPSAHGRAVRFRILIDGQPAGADAGVDVDAAGQGVVTEHRLYQLVRQRGAIQDRTVQIEFLDPGVEAFAFTFG